METSALKIQMELLKLQIELAESNYKYAVELQKDLNTLHRMRDNIRELKWLLQSAWLIGCGILKKLKLSISHCQ